MNRYGLSFLRNKKKQLFYRWVLIVFMGTLSPLIGQSSTQLYSPKSRSPEKSLDSDQQALLSEMQESFRRMLDKQDKELDGLLKELKKAPKEKKIDYLTLIVTRLIEQRKEMHQEMDAMRSRMRELKSLSQSAKLPSAVEAETSSSPNPSTSSSTAQPAQDSQDSESSR
ncbi:hypothetical protein IT6_07845 [Methylacidiphilum caldifontis]|nr:hypothetical protein [Methylacidiphilum caldifontis]QSR88287.1 hypothetical protein IT6_07845 [Methylacidiphilum caldifontis]